MFRHTRDTLRQYYRLGLLDRDIPQRDVRDDAISLEPNREVPCIALSASTCGTFIVSPKSRNVKR
jgi:hypothetical protein